jgi:hypothetical protein
MSAMPGAFIFRQKFHAKPLSFTQGAKRSIFAAMRNLAALRETFSL